MNLQPLGDQAALIHCESEEAASGVASAVRAAPPSWLQDVVLAYASVAVFFDVANTRYSEVAQWLVNVKTTNAKSSDNRLVAIPCCYELGQDLERVAAVKKISAADVSRLHTSQVYTVYAVGFCPGFPYMGYLPEELAGVPRLDSPRLRVEPGSVGLTGRQTGIYPLVRPGGWNLIGRTPVQLVDLESDYFALMPGDRVQFVPITQNEYRQQLGRRVER